MFLKGLAVLACTRSNRRFVSRRRSAGSYISGQHPNGFHYSFCTRRCMVPLGFCCGGFSSTAGYVPGNEARHLSTRTTCTRLADHFQRAVTRFYPSNSENLSTLLSKPFGFGSGRPDSGFPLLLSSNDASPHPFHLPVPVKMPISNFDCEWIVTWNFSMSSRKYFKFRPYFIRVLWKTCGYSFTRVVDIFV